jgi:hypothetical protein
MTSFKDTLKPLVHGIIVVHEKKIDKELDFI